MTTPLQTARTLAIGICDTESFPSWHDADQAQKACVRALLDAIGTKVPLKTQIRLLSTIAQDIHRINHAKLHGNKELFISVAVLAA